MNNLFKTVKGVGAGRNLWRNLLKREQRSARMATLLTLFIPLYFSTLSAQATTTSNRADVALQATVIESLTVIVANPAVVFGVVTGGARNTAPAGQTISITSAWTLSAGETVKLYAYFDTASSAMTGALLGDVIPTSAFTGSFNGGAYQSFTQNSPFTTGATALPLYSVAVTAANAILTARVDALALAMNLTGIQLHADTYTGVMHLQAQAL